MRDNRSTLKMTTAERDTAHALACNRCGAVLGTVGFPTASELTAAMGRSPFAALAGLIPADFSAQLLEILHVLCMECLKKGARDNGKAQNETDAHAATESTAPARGRTDQR